MTQLQFSPTGLIAWMVMMACTIVAGPLRADELLTVGSKAPALNIEHWIKRADGKVSTVTKFEPGKVYVVEFWATWCGPCIQGMPHLAELQREFGEKGVQIIGVSSEDLQTVQEFLSRPIPKRNGDKEKLPATYGELTSAYSLTCDPDESTEKDYMQAAFQSTIPNAFIVGKDGKVEWIGHPGQIDDVLREVVSGTWKRDEFGKKFLAMQKAEMAKTKLNEVLQQRDYAKAFELIEARFGETTEDQEKLELKLTKVQISLVQNKMPEATVFLKETYAFAKDRADMIDLISWHVYEQSEQRRADLTPLLKEAFAQAEKALPGVKGEPLGSLLDTTAHLAYKLGNVDKAIQLATQAIEHAGGENKEFSKQFLEQLKAEKSEKK